MSVTETVVLCGDCKSAVKSVANPEPHDEVTCPVCRKSDRFDNVMESVRAYATEVAAEYMSKAILDVTRRSKFITADIKKRPNRSFEWICSDMGI